MAQQDKRKDVRSVVMNGGTTVITYPDGTVEKVSGPADLELGTVTGGVRLDLGNG